MKHLLVLLCFFAQACSTDLQQTPSEKVELGVDVLLHDRIKIVQNKRIGLITNPTGVTSEFVSTIDVLFLHPDVHLVALYGPEHGVRGNVPAGEYIKNYTDEKTGLPVFSLYGRSKKPTVEMLEKVDMLLFDIQDVGVRHYTYIYTMAYAMTAAKENNIPFVVLDRPNPMGGELVEGPVLEEKFSSFIGLYPIPLVHGMTVGELALLFNSEFGIDCDLTVIPMKNWQRSKIFKETGLVWIPTSPHIPHDTTPFYYATTGCIGELHSVNEGVGYTAPFEYIGAEWVNAQQLADSLTVLNLPGVIFRPTFYRPFYGAKNGQQLQGVEIFITDYKKFKPVFTQIHILSTLFKLYPLENIFNPERIDMFCKAIGTDYIKEAIQRGKNIEDIFLFCQNETNKFMAQRQKYLLY